MKKALLKCNEVFYTIMYSASLWYVGFLYGDTFPHLELDMLLFPAVYFVLFWIGRYLVKASTWSHARTYCSMAVFTFTFITFFWVLWVVNSSQDLQMGFPPTVYVRVILYPAIVFCFSVLTTIFYFICAIITRKEKQACAKVGYTEHE